MKLDAIKKKAGRPSQNNLRQLVTDFETVDDENSSQAFANIRSDDSIGEKTGESGRQVQRFIRLTELNTDLLDIVDRKKLKFNPAVELSYLKREEQENFLEAMDYAQNTPSLSQAQRLKKLSQEGKCTLEVMCLVMDEQKKGDVEKVVIKNDVLKKYFPKSYTPKQMENTIIKLLEQWQKKRNREISL